MTAFSIPFSACAVKVINLFATAFPYMSVIFAVMVTESPALTEYLFDHASSMAGSAGIVVM
jgi:hypothetical protein